MNERNFFTGSVFQFYVPEIKKYAFCKFFDFKHVSEFHGLLAQVFNKFSDTEKNDIDDLINCEPLYGPRSMHRWPNLRKDTGWKALGILSGPHDDIIPDFKGTLSRVMEDDSKVAQWYAIHSLTKGEDCEYAQVKHLERVILTVSSLGLTWRTGMEYCRINGLSIEDHYNLNEVSVRDTYWQMINIPVYETIPKEIRERALAAPTRNLE